MNFFKKIFGKGENGPDDKDNNNPDNTKLIHLLNSYSKSRSQGNYRQIVLEFMNGNAYLLLPSINKPGDKNSGWQGSDEDTSLKLTSVYDQDGLKVLGAFTDKDSLFNWAKKSTEYTALGTKAITEICQQLGIGRIIINSDQKNMFVLERSRENLKEMKIRKGTEIAIGTPTNPLDRRILGKLVTNFQKVNSIERAYQYAQVMNGELSIVLGICMSTISDNSKAALFNAVADAMEGEKKDSFVDVRILDSQEDIEPVSKIDNALFYSK